MIIEVQRYQEIRERR